MHRDQLYNLLNEYNPGRPEEIQTKYKMLEFLAACEDCFERSCQVGHFTGSAWLLNKEGDKVLLMHHAKLDAWLQLGGHCDGDSDVLRVAIKEAQEESGIQDIKAVSEDIFDIDMHLFPPRHNEHAHYHFDIRFLLQVQSNESIQRNHEAKALQWFPPDADALPTSRRSVLRMLEKWQELSYEEA